jgi:hypothetical protein
VAPTDKFNADAPADVREAVPKLKELDAVTDTLVVAPVEGSVIVNVPVLLPAVIVNVALLELVTACAVMDAPLPPESVKAGLPGVPAVHAVLVPVIKTLLPVVFSINVVGFAAIEYVDVLDVPIMEST